MMRWGLGLLVVYSISSYAVVRVGGGRVQSNSSLGSFQMDGTFPVWRATEQEGVILSTIPGASPTGVASQNIFVDEFSTEHPEAAALDQNDLRHLFENTYDYTAIFHDNPCVVGFYKGTTSHTYIVTWGQGRGFKLRTGDSSDVGRRAILKMIRSLTLEPGACSWN